MKSHFTAIYDTSETVTDESSAVKMYSALWIQGVSRKGISDVDFPQMKSSPPGFDLNVRNVNVNTRADGPTAAENDAFHYVPPSYFSFSSLLCFRKKKQNKKEQIHVWENVNVGVFYFSPSDLMISSSTLSTVRGESSRLSHALYSNVSLTLSVSSSHSRLCFGKKTVKLVKMMKYDSESEWYAANFSGLYSVRLLKEGRIEAGYAAHFRYVTCSPIPRLGCWRDALKTYPVIQEQERILNV